jgi:hypothetical protein
MTVEAAGRLETAARGADSNGRSFPFLARPHRFSSTLQNTSSVMTDSLAEFLDDLTLHLENEIAKAPATLAQALRCEDAPLSTVEKLRILARHEKTSVASYASDHHDDSQMLAV